MYSKENPFIISSNAHATFYSNGTQSPTGVGFIYNNPQPSILWDQIFENIIPCMEDFALAKSYQIGVGNSEEWIENSDALKVYPNPNNGDLLTVDYKLSPEEVAKLVIVDVTGKTVFDYGIIEGGNGTATLQLNKLKTGVYLIRISGQTKMIVTRLIIQ